MKYSACKPVGTFHIQTTTPSHMLCYGLDTGMVEALGAVQPTLLCEVQASERPFSNNTKRKRGKEEKTECLNSPLKLPKGSLEFSSVRLLSGV